MNTPDPCNKCKHLYFDTLSKDSSTPYIECKIGEVPENGKCSKFIQWDSKPSSVLKVLNEAFALAFDHLDKKNKP